MFSKAPRTASMRHISDRVMMAELLRFDSSECNNNRGIAAADWFSFFPWHTYLTQLRWLSLDEAPLKRLVKVRGLC